MGNGQANFDPVSNCYFIDLSVTSQYDSDIVGDTDRWRISFEHASQILFDATKGRMQFGEISFLNDGPIASTDDILLSSQIGSSATTYSTVPFTGHVVLKNHVMAEPLVTVHELGHYVGTLGDEYRVFPSGVGGGFRNVIQRLCQDDATTHECIMEFARNYGLQLDHQGEPSTTQPLDSVGHFCESSHVAQFGNGQEFKNQESCWDTLARHYPELNSSDPGTLSAILDMNWIARSGIYRYALAIPSNQHFRVRSVDAAIKNATKAWVRRIATAGDELAMAFGTAAVNRPMSQIKEEEIVLLNQLIDNISLIDQTDNGLELSSILEQFASKTSAYQSLVVLAPGDYQTDISYLAEALTKKRISLITMTFGPGTFTNQLQELSKSSKWVTHKNFAIAIEDVANYSFTLQNAILELYFLATPGSGLVERICATLPAISMPNQGSKDEVVEEVIEAEPKTLDLDLELDSLGVDYPVYVEAGAKNVVFLLCEYEVDSIDMSVLKPGTTEFRNVPVQDSHPSQTIRALDQTGNISGRWIVRIRRRAGMRQVPFLLIAAVRNNAIATLSSVVVAESKQVKLGLKAFHRLALDHMLTFVNIERLVPDEHPGGYAHRGVMLQRQRVLDPTSQRTVELSSGWYEGEVVLTSGSYIATFRTGHHGQAVVATNPTGELNANLVFDEQHQIPVFTRVQQCWIMVP